MPPARVKSILFVPDAHWPFVNKKHWNLMLRVGQWLNPDILVCLGDLVDCYSVSKYPKSPDRRIRLIDEIESGNEALDDLDDLRAREKWFFKGNHETRVNDFIAEKAPELHGIVDIDRLLRLKERGYKIVPYMKHARIGKLNVTHGTKDCGETGHLKARQEFNGNYLGGHAHWLGIGYRGNAQGDSRVGMSCGWLGDVEKIDYAHRVEALRWQSGFGVGHMASDGVVFLQAVPIVKNRCCVNGVIFE